jgi:hypothetical protein
MKSGVFAQHSLGLVILKFPFAGVSPRTELKDRLRCAVRNETPPIACRLCFLTQMYENLRMGLRVLYAFDPRRAAILLIGGDKTRNPKWYDEYVPVADRLFDDHLREIEKEEKKHGKEFS